jgi:CheY-like chemotaxis protein
VALRGLRCSLFTGLGHYLEHHGAVVTRAANAVEALAKLQEVRPYIIVTDLSMPGLDGIEFVTRARAIFDERQPPVAASVVTASAASDETLHYHEPLAQRVGARDHRAGLTRSYWPTTTSLI